MRRLLTAALCAVALGLATPGLALAGSPGPVGSLQVRAPGEAAWSDHLGRPLFVSPGLLVPTDRVRGGFELRNDSPAAARASLAVVSRGPVNDLTRSLTVGTDLGGRRSTRSLTLAQQGTCRTLVTGPTIRPGGDQAVEVSLDFPDVPGRTATELRAELAVVIRLSEVGAAGTVDICGVQAEASACRSDVAVVPLLGRGAQDACSRVRAAGNDGSLASTADSRTLRTLVLVGAMLFGGGAWLAYRTVLPDVVPDRSGQRRGRNRRGPG